MNIWPNTVTELADEITRAYLNHEPKVVLYSGKERITVDVQSVVHCANKIQHKTVEEWLKDYGYVGVR